MDVSTNVADVYSVKITDHENCLKHNASNLTCHYIYMNNFPQVKLDSGPFIMNSWIRTIVYLTILEIAIADPITSPNVKNPFNINSYKFFPKRT